MELILAVDLRGGLVVHGAAGVRETYRPLDWGLAPSAEPEAYLAALRPRHMYIADLDRIMGTGDHGTTIARLAPHVETCYVDAGFTSAVECRAATGFVPVLGTETAADALGDCPGGVLSLDCRDGRVLPHGEDPVAFLERVRDLAFAGHLYLDIGSVGTARGLDAALLARVRAASDRPCSTAAAWPRRRPRPARRRGLRRRDRGDRGPPGRNPARRDVRRGAWS